MNKLYRKGITLEPGVWSTPFPINGGINFYDDELKLEYPINSHPNSISVSLISSTNHKLLTPLPLEINGYMAIVFPNIYKDILNKYPGTNLENYDSIIFQSKTKMFLVVSLERQEMAI